MTPKYDARFMIHIPKNIRAVHDFVFRCGRIIGFCTHIFKYIEMRVKQNGIDISRCILYVRANNEYA